jgi:hypothetical protein
MSIASMERPGSMPVNAGDLAVVGRRGRRPTADRSLRLRNALQRAQTPAVALISADAPGAGLQRIHDRPLGFLFEPKSRLREPLKAGPKGLGVN